MAELSRYFPTAEEADRIAALSFSDTALGMLGSQILSISYAVRERIAAGAEVAQFTVGDFSPSQFQVPGLLKDAIVEYVKADQTNYPPAFGMPELRRAVADSYRRELGLDYPDDSVIACAGARGILYAAFQVLLNPGEKAVAPSPGWNNNYFAQLAGAELVCVTSRPEDGFMPTAEGLAPHLKDARLLVICSPMNPTGTMIRGDRLAAICDLVLAENERREAAGERLLYLLYDHVYRLLTLGDVEHVTPVGLRPEMARYTIFCDAISKGFAATGLRLGWMVGPVHVANKVKALMTHVGAWPPKPIQLAAARLLDDEPAVQAYMKELRAGVHARLDRLYAAIEGWKAEGLAVDAIAPEGAMYLSVRFDGFADADELRIFLLEEAGCAIVPFTAFGDDVNKGWVRFSVGAVGLDEVDACMARLESALRARGV